ncbi:hypothetical protein J6590_087876 [Homalodisca vitripennis]|nr:hypothetical protein J6590_087876 [Homalodisca vitripennis]
MEDWSMKAQIFCQIFGGFPLECTIGQDGKKKFCFSPMACLWSVTLASFQFLASMLWVRELYNMRNLADKLYDHTSRIISTLLIVDGLSMTVMVLVLFQSYNRNHLRFTRVCDVLEVFNTKLNQSTKKANATKKMVGACVVVTALIPIISSILWTNYLEKISLIHNHLYLVILHACMVSTFWAQGVFLVHFSHITQSISSSFTRVTVKMERVVIRNHFRSLLPYQILNHGSDREEGTEHRLRIGLAGQLQGALSIKWQPT